MISVKIQSKWYFSLWDLVKIWGFEKFKNGGVFMYGGNVRLLLVGEEEVDFSSPWPVGPTCFVLYAAYYCTPIFRSAPDPISLKGFFSLFPFPKIKVESSKIKGSKPINGLIPENQEHTYSSLSCSKWVPFWMGTWMKNSMLSNLKDLLILVFPVMFIDWRKLCMA